MRVLAFIWQRSFARYVVFDLAAAARTLGWSVHWVDIEGRLLAATERPVAERAEVVAGILSEIEQFDPHLVFTYGLEYLARVFETFAPDSMGRFDEMLRRPAVHFFFDFGFPFDRPLDATTRPYVEALQSPGAFVCCWDADAIQRLREYGILKTQHFPMAVNQHLFHRAPEEVAGEPSIPIVFVGGPDADRNRCLAPLAKRGLQIYGYDATGWTAPLRRCHVGAEYLRPALRRIYNRTRICVNVTRRQGHSSLNMRVYEAMACGALMLTDDKADARTLFRDGEELVVYRDERDLRDKVDAYLADEGERVRIADAGRHTVLREHTYDVRLEAIAPLLVQHYTEHALFAKLGAYAASDPAKALAFVDFLRTGQQVTQNADTLACRAAELHAGRDDVARATCELETARRLNPGHLAARDLADRIRVRPHRSI